MFSKITVTAAPAGTVIVRVLKAVSWALRLIVVEAGSETGVEGDGCVVDAGLVAGPVSVAHPENANNAVTTISGHNCRHKCQHFLTVHPLLIL